MSQKLQTIKKINNNARRCNVLKIFSSWMTGLSWPQAVSALFPQKSLRHSGHEKHLWYKLICISKLLLQSFTYSPPFAFTYCISFNKEISVERRKLCPCLITLIKRLCCICQLFMILSVIHERWRQRKYLHQIERHASKSLIWKQMQNWYCFQF